MNELEKARIKIDKIDEKMQELFFERIDVAKEVAKYKIIHNMDIFDELREKEILDKRLALNTFKNLEEYYATFLKEVMNISKKYQSHIINKDKVAYCGVVGAFSHIASSHLFPNSQLNNYESFQGVCDAIENGEATCGILPFENSYTGSVGEVFDLLSKYELYIDTVYDLKISQNLLGIKGAKIEDIKKVYSKDQAFLQSKTFLEGRNWEIHNMANTAMAAQFVAEQNNVSFAAIAAKENAQYYNLDILVEDIQSTMQNTTRFIVLRKEKKIKGNHFALILTLAHKSGSLLKALSCFANNNLNMDLIISRAIPEHSWQYYFYLEIEGMYDSTDVKEALLELGKHCDHIKYVGSFDK